MALICDMTGIVPSPNSPLGPPDPPLPPHADAGNPPGHLSLLNPAQAAAAAHGNLPLLIVAGAGSGKTRTLIHRVSALINRGVPPFRILLLTFTRRSAQEMLSRVEKLIGPASRQVQGGTFHGVANQLLRRFGPAAGLSPTFSILDQSDATDFMGLTRSSLGYGDPKKPPPDAPRNAPRFPTAKTLVAIHSRIINTSGQPPESPEDLKKLLASEWPHFLPWVAHIHNCFQDYASRKAEHQMLDYDDLLLAWALLLEKAPSIAAAIRNLYDHVLVDEYQDTNPLQSRILRALCTNGQLTVVGDDAQSIYSFRGATIRNILDFPKEFPNTQIITLEQNYRSTSAILATANALISKSPERYTKELYSTREDGEKPFLVVVSDEHTQSEFVVNHIVELNENGTPLSEIAVLFRAGYLSADLELELNKRQIPYVKWGGLKFLESAHVKDLLAFLRVLENPRDEVSWYRLLNMINGIGDATAGKALELLSQHEWQPMAIGAVKVSARAKSGLQALAALLDGITRVERAESRHNSQETIRLVRQLYDEILKTNYDDWPPRLSDLEQLEGIAAEYPSRVDFLAALAIEPPSSTQDLARGKKAAEDDALVLSTVHSAKGKEWDTVFVIHASDGVFPIAQAIGNGDQEEEERRLLYVAMTRARNELYVTFPLRSYRTIRGADYSFSQLSRFIDADVQETMNQVSATPPIEQPESLQLHPSDDMPVFPWSPRQRPASPPRDAP